MAELIDEQLGNYRIVRLLGQGGFADVYLGEHIYLKTLAAIKVLHTQLNEINLQNFINEAQRVATLKHARIVRVLEFGVEKKTPFLVMEYAPKGTLRQRHKEGTTVPLANAVAYTKAIAEPLQYSHDQKLIHCDIKPENMLIGAADEILLSDFGVAVEAHSTYSRKSEKVGGTLQYMAPEQFKSKASFSSDQYALAIVVYEWLSGVPPFSGDFAQLMYQHIGVKPSSLVEKIPTLSPDVEQVVFRGLEKEPHLRFASVSEFAQALEQAYKKSLEKREPDRKLDTSRNVPPIPYTPNELISTYQRHASVVDTLSWSTDSRYIASGGGDDKVHIWRPTSTSPRLIYSGHTNWIADLAWSPDNTLIASASADETVQVWEANTGAYRYTYKGHTDQVSTVVWSPAGARIASGSWDKTIHIWDANASGPAVICSGHQGWIRSVAWSYDGDRILSISRNGTVRIWDAYTGKERRSFSIHTGIVNAVAWSADKTRIAFADREIIRVWDITRGQIIATHRDHIGEVDALAWSPDGTYVASGSKDTTICIWESKSGKTLSTYRGHSDEVRAISWSPDGTHIASGSADKTIQVWQSH